MPTVLTYDARDGLSRSFQSRRTMCAGRKIRGASPLEQARSQSWGPSVPDHDKVSSDQDICEQGWCLAVDALEAAAKLVASACVVGPPRGC